MRPAAAALAAALLALPAAAPASGAGYVHLLQFPLRSLRSEATAGLFEDDVERAGHGARLVEVDGGRLVSTFGGATTGADDWRLEGGWIGRLSEVSDWVWSAFAARRDEGTRTDHLDLGVSREVRAGVVLGGRLFRTEAGGRETLGASFAARAEIGSDQNVRARVDGLDADGAGLGLIVEYDRPALWGETRTWGGLRRGPAGLSTLEAGLRWTKPIIRRLSLGLGFLATRTELDDESKTTTYRFPAAARLRLAKRTWLNLGGIHRTDRKGDRDTDTTSFTGGLEWSPARSARLHVNTVHLEATPELVDRVEAAIVWLLD